MSDAVTFVSLGPGDPELITLKGLKTLQQADIIFCPYTSASSRAMDILLDLGIDNNKIELFNIPMNKNRSQAILTYKIISEKIAGYFKEGVKVAITAEGDAGFYSSIHYISDSLHQQGISIKKIAGVPAFIACGALANLHIAKQEQELIVIPGIATSQKLKKNIEDGKSIVIMKPSLSEDEIKQVIQEIEEANVHYFENAGINEKEFYTQDIQEITSRKFPYFSLLIITKEPV